MDKGPILLLMAIILMIGAAITPPVSYETPSGIFAKSNFEQFSEELAEHNISDPYKCLHFSPESLAL